MNEPVVCCNHNCNQGRDCPKRNKELTNAEILWLADEYSDEENLVADCVGFARAILLKAQEK